MFESFEFYLQKKFKKLLLKPFSYWKAYNVGIIDRDGNKLREPKPGTEKHDYNVFDELARRIIKLFQKYTPSARGMQRYKMFKEFLADGFIEALDEENHLSEKYVDEEIRFSHLDGFIQLWLEQKKYLRRR